MTASLTPLPTLLAHFRQHDPLIAGVLESVDLSEWFEECEPPAYYRQLTRNIVYQQLAGAAASTIYKRFETLVGEVTPANVLRIPDQSLRDAGLSWGKVKYVKDLATKTQTGEVILDNLDTLSDAAVIAELIKVKGIGHWTAEMFLMFTLHRPDIFSYLDLGLKKGITKLYKITDPSQAQIEKITKAWTPYKTYGSIALWHHLDN